MWSDSWELKTGTEAMELGRVMDRGPFRLPG